MTPFDGPPTLPGVATGKSRKASKRTPIKPYRPKRPALGATPAQVYANAERILGIRDQFARDIEENRRFIAASTTSTTRRRRPRSSVWSKVDPSC